MISQLVSQFRGFGLAAVGVVLTGAVYFAGQYRSQARGEDNATPAIPAWNIGKAFEGAGLEGRFTAQGLEVKTLDGPARSSGLLVGDIIQSVNGQPFMSDVQLRLLAPGAPLMVLRNNRVTQITYSGAANPNAVDVRPVEVRGISGQLTPEGLWANFVEGEAAAWGLRTGDLIRSVNGQPLTVRRDAVSVISALDPARGFVFEVVRGGTRMAVPFAAASQQATAPTWGQQVPIQQPIGPAAQPRNQGGWRFW